MAKKEIQLDFIRGGGVPKWDEKNDDEKVLHIVEKRKEYLKYVSQCEEYLKENKDVVASVKTELEQNKQKEIDKINVEYEFLDSL